MSSFKILKINNNKEQAISSGKWKDPGAKLYDQLLNAFYCDGDIPTDTKELEREIKDGKYLQWNDFLKEAYLVAPVKGIKNSPYGVTPYSRSGCKYPHHVIRNGELVVSIPGLKAAYSRAKQMGVFSGDLRAHLERHYKELGIYEDSTMAVNERIEHNFKNIEDVIYEHTGIDLHCPTTVYEEDIDNGVIRPLMRDDVTNPYFVDWLFKSYEFSDDDPEKFDYDMLVNNDAMGNYVHGYFVNDKLEGIIKVKHRKPEDYYAISMLFVNDQNESKGIGQSLMKYVISKYGDKEMRLNVFEYNSKAMHIYKKYGFDVTASAVAKPEADGDTNKLVGQKFYKMVRKPDVYDPPLSFDKLPDHLKNDPVHAWRAQTGIELIHKEPSLEELNRIWNNWNKMTDEQKGISDQKSMELFGKNNHDHYMELIRGYNTTDDQSAISIFPSGHFEEYKNDFQTATNPDEIFNEGYGFTSIDDIKEHYRTESGENMDDDDLNWITAYLMEDADSKSSLDDGKYKITHKNSKYKGWTEYAVLTKDGKEAASCIIDSKTGDCANVETKPEYRRQGYMQYLLKYLIKFKGVKYAQVQQDNRIAISLYRKIGFEVEFKYTDKEKGPIYSMAFQGDASKLIVEGYDLFTEAEEPPSMPDDDQAPVEEPNEEPEKESMPKKTDKVESSKNGVRRKKLYIAFIEWCKEYNNKNTFGSIFDKDAFNVSYPFVPEEMRYFYRLANPMLCVLGGDLTFFPASELRKLNSKNSHLNQLMIFAATPNDVRVFNVKDKKIYLGTEENGAVKLGVVLGDTFDLYIQKMINKGDILNAPLEEAAEFYE